MFLIALVSTLFLLFSLVNASCHYYCANEVDWTGHRSYECDENVCGAAFAGQADLGRGTSKCMVGKDPLSESCPDFGYQGLLGKRCEKSPCQGKANPCACKNWACPSVPDEYDGYPCLVTRDCVDWGVHCYGYDYYGSYSANTRECVMCLGKFKYKKYGDAYGLPVDCEGNAPSLVCSGTP